MAKKKSSAKRAKPTARSTRSSAKAPRLDHELESLIKRADRAYNAFRHEEALEAYSEALAWKPAKALPLEERFRLLVRRADTFQALGNFEERAADVVSLEALAVKSGRADLLAEAAFRRADAASGLEDPQRTVRLAKKALKMARSAGERILEARALDALGTAYLFGLEQADQAREHLQRALELFGDNSEAYLSHAHAWVALAFLPGQEGAGSSERYALKGLDLVRQAGDQRIEARILNLLSIFANDAADKRRYAEQALALAQELDLRETTGQSFNHLSLLYLHMGLYETALDFIGRGVQIARQGLGRMTVSAFLESYARIAMALGDYASGEAAFLEALKIAEEGNQRSFIAYNSLGLGRLKLASGDLKAAARLMKRAADHFRELGQVSELPTALIALAEVRLAQNKWTSALDLALEAVGTLQSVREVNQDFPPQDVWWTYFQVLRAHPKNRKYLDTKDHSKGTLDDEAERALDRAFELAKSNVAEVTDTGLKRSYWNRVETNRSILLEIARQHAEEGWTSDVLSGNEPGNLQEQLQRMLDIGVRMNEMRDPDELSDFVMSQLVELTGAEDVALIFEDEKSQRTCLAQKGFASGVDPVAFARPLLDEAGRLSHAVIHQDVADFDSSKKARDVFASQSMIAVPLQTLGELKSYLYAANHTLFGPFSQADLTLISAFANQAAAALDNATLYSDLERRVEERTQALKDRAAELSFINSIQRALASNLDMSKIYQIVGDQLRKIFGTQVVTITSSDIKRGRTHFVYGYEKGEMYESLDVPLNSLYRWLLERNETFVRNGDLPEFVSEFRDFEIPAGEMPKSLVWVPIPHRSGDPSIESITIEDIDGERVFGDSDVRLLETLAGGMAVALENARLLDETRQRNAELSVINSIQEGLASELDIQDIFNLVGDKIQEVFDAQIVGILTYDPEDDKVNFRYAVERGQHFKIPTQAPSGFSRHIIRTGQSLVINEDMEAASKKYNAPVIAGEEIKSLIGVPLVVGDRVRGVISLQNIDREHAFSEADIRLLTTLASSMSVAIENARLFDQTNRLLDETSQRAAELSLINSIQRALSAQLEMASIYTTVIERLQSIFESQVVVIYSADLARHQMSLVAGFEKGHKVEPTIVPLNSLYERLISMDGTFVFNSDFPEFASQFDDYKVPGGELPRSIVGVPIPRSSDPQTVEIIGIQDIDGERTFTESDVRLLETLANSVGVALENARLLDETKERAAELSIINSVQQGLASKLDMQAIYDLVGDRIRDIFDAQVVHIRIYDPETDIMTYPYVLDRDERLDVPPTKIEGVGFSGEIIRTRQPIMINRDYKQRAKELGSYLLEGQKEWPKSVVWCPILSGDEVTGIVLVENFDREDVFSQRDVDLLTTLASSMSVALENARLFDETNRLLEETRQRAAELGIINNVGQALVKKLEFDAILELVGERLRDLFEADTAYIMLYDPETRWSHTAYYIDRGERIHLQPGTLKTGLNVTIVDTKEPLLLGTAKESEALGAVWIAAKGKQDSNQSFLGVPFFNGDEVAGVISVQSYQQHAYDQEDVRLLTTLASSMSVALENARLFEETNRLLDETRQRNAELAVINNIQEGLASKLDIQGIFDLVGDTIQEIFDAQVVSISTYDRKTNIEAPLYIIERGDRLQADPGAAFGFSARILDTLEPMLINEGVDELYPKLLEKYGSGVNVGEHVKSYLGVPLVIRQDPKGVISLQNIDREHAFSEPDLRLLTTIASSMSVALENARLFEETSRLLGETRQRNAELAAVNTISHALVAETEIGNLIQLVGEQVRTTFEADIAYVAMLDPRSDSIEFPYHHGEDMAPIRRGEGLASQILDSGKPLLLNRDIDSAAKELNTQRIGLRAASYLGVPIVSGRQAIGVISVQSTHDEDRFDEGDVNLLTTIAANAGAAIANARLYEETRQRASELAAINVIGRGLLSQMDLEKVIELVGQSITEIFGSDDFGIAILSEETNKITVPYVTSDGKRLAPLELAAGEGLVSVVSRTQRPLRLESWDEIEEYGTQKIHPEKQDELPPEYSWLGVPIMSGGEVSGVIFASRHRNSAFSDGDERLLSTIAANMGVAIRNAQLYAETERRAEELSTLNEIGREAVASLDLPSILDRMTLRAREMLRAETSAVILLDDDGTTLRPIAAAGAAADQVMNFAWQLGEGIIGDIVENGRAERVSDAAGDPRAVHIEGTEDAAPDEKIMVAPLFARETVIGAMAVWRGAGQDVFDGNDLSFLTGLSHQAGASIYNARLFDEVQREKLYSEAIVENNPVAIITTDLDAVIVSWNPAAETLFGFTADEAVGRGLDDLIANETLRPEAEAYTRQTLETGRFSAVMRRTRKDGSLVDLEAVVLPVIIGGQTVGFIAIYHDITELKRAEAALLQQKEYLEAVVLNSPVAIVTADQDAIIVSWNPAAEKLFGYTAAEAIGEDIDRLIADSNSTMHAEAVDFSQEAREGRLHVNTQRVRKDGTMVDVELLGVPVTVDGQQAGIIAIYHDITELKRATEEAEAANEAKSAFLATMSHEIRTPMNAVIGMSGLLLDTELSDEQHEFAEIIRSSSDALLAIINDILDFSKIEAGKMDLEYQPFDLRECVEGTLDLVAGRTFEKDLDLAYVIEDGTPTRIIGDVTRFRQILLNLLTNAVKFTDRGEVVVTIQAESSPPAEADTKGQEARKLHVAVRDTGIGIPKDRMDRLFQSFSQVDASTARKYGGTGLGLAISRRLTEMMGGTMWAESNPGEGATFHFTLMAQLAEDSAEAPAGLLNADPHLKGRRVLVVDDNDTNRRILSLQVKSWGMLPRDTHSPYQALEWVEAGEAFDVAILDMHMPEFDGLSLAREIRKHRDRETLPMILFTSLGRREVGGDDIDFSAYLTKPIKPSQLLDALSMVFAERPTRVERRADLAPALDTELGHKHPLRVLLAEDNAVNQKLALRLLAQMGYRADVAANGQEALDSLGRQTYDVVLMDVQMPEMDGLEASRQINRRWTQSERPRIVAMTANAMQGDRERCLEAGMDDYITKPIRVHELMEALTRVPARGGADR